MIVKKVEISYVEVPFKECTTFGFADLGDTAKLNYTKIKINSHGCGIGTRSNYTYYYTIGCQNVTKRQIECAIDDMLGLTKSSTLITLKSKSGSKLKSEVVETSDNYYITSNSKAYPKSEYSTIEVTVNNRILNFTRSGWCWKNYRLNVFNEKQDIDSEIIEKLNYLLEIGNAIEQFSSFKPVTSL